MLAQRATQQSLRQLAASNPSMASQMVFKSFAVGSSLQTRPVATQKMTPADSYQILVAQRKNRPTSPHLTIYKPQMTWIPSALNRVTGSVLSGGFYVFGAAYLVSPLFGWHLDSASMAAAFGSLPVAAKVATKFAVAMPFTFHSFNGLRHLSWDLGKTFQNKTVITTGYVMLGVSTASALWLALFA
ncbi:succinate dehydrogenase cytochrome b560 subunit [Hyaloscypha bicolor E]|uniref:Succinate dehydrogenase cytochrome b560 subunit n=1 Tax=Hyaloscypha bicolor E TaxID=1095630 RepID=A0A2J6SQ99_9HELO|nr:succinate dehydrogenase cytochrome b560 subunit [Hyaloscypha bicolor E]PMD52920.1 succinate dehydrogenase cytochrome b560 subunit [Hyaloscypha bicolor E]